MGKMFRYKLGAKYLDLIFNNTGNNLIEEPWKN